MVKITIIGWYGTETIGDRAILAGILHLLGETCDAIEIKLGSIYPFFTERTLMEDMDFFKQSTNSKTLSVSLFDSSRQKELYQAIKTSDATIVGGGPLCDIFNMFMLEYALITAKKHHKKTIVLGCGIGPLQRKMFQKSLLRIIDNSDLTIFRDQVSKIEYEQLSRQKDNTIAAIDPAVFAAEIFSNSNNNLVNNDTIVACIRKYPIEKDKRCSQNINHNIIHFFKQLQQKHDKEILLLPMHYFQVGDDDRMFLNEIKIALNNSAVHVQNTPLSTVETMKLIKNSTIGIGMRFHSVVLQTILNGNNVILDYTNPQTGKIIGFLQQINAWQHYSKSYIPLQNTAPEINLIPKSIASFKYNQELISSFKSQYLTSLRSIFK